jgi:hypothetical protein
VRGDIGESTQLHATYQIAGGDAGAQGAAIVGLNNRLRLGDAWTLNTLFERRFGVQDASIVDPVRALPFLQDEEDYWSAGVGVEFLPPSAPYRASARGEYRDGDFRSTRLFSLAGDLALNRSLAILTLNEYLWTEQSLGSGWATSERTSSLWGLAFRPSGSNALNVLTKLHWLEETNPIGGGVLGGGDERRLIGVVESIWAPREWSELAIRYALRRTESEQALGDGTSRDVSSWADYIGGRVNVEVLRWLELRGEARLLLEHESDSRRWDAAPSLVFFPVAGFEAALGYRFGDLRDPDFAVRGGHGAFVIFAARITERVFPTSADFWRPRFGQR